MTESEIRAECIKQFGVAKYRKFASLLDKTDESSGFRKLNIWQQSIVDHIATAFPEANLDSREICTALHTCDMHDQLLVKGPGYTNGCGHPMFNQVSEDLFPFGYRNAGYHCPQCKAACEKWVTQDADEFAIETIADSFPAHIALPQEFRLLVGAYLKFGYPLSGRFRPSKHSATTIKRWFGSDAACEHVALFGDHHGSLYCLWRSSDGSVPIVHLDYDHKRNMVLATSPLDFIRLLAIGYREIGHADLNQPPVPGRDNFPINAAFQNWVIETFNAKIPAIGAEIVDAAQAAHPNFEAWVKAHCG